MKNKKRFTGNTGAYYERKPSRFLRLLYFFRIKKRPKIYYNTFDEAYELINKE